MDVSFRCQILVLFTGVSATSVYLSSIGVVCDRTSELSCMFNLLAILICIDTVNVLNQMLLL